MSSIVFFIHNISSVGGTERIFLGIINELAKRNHNIHLLGLRGNPSKIFFPLEPNVNVISLHLDDTKRILKVPYTQRRIRQLVNSNQIGTFVTIESNMVIHSIPALAFTGVRHVVWEAFNFRVSLGVASRSLARQLSLCFAHTIVTQTARDKTFWEQGAWYRRAKLTHISNPIFLEEQEVSENPSKTVISVGRLSRQKGFDLLIDAWYQLPVRLRDEWRLLIIGDGEDRMLLEKKIAELGIGESVELVGATKAVFMYFEKASVYCLSSRFEGLPMVLLEALAFHLPIAAFDCDTGPKELIEDGRNGILVEPGNVSKMALSLAALMEDESLRASMRNYKSQRLPLLKLDTIIDQWNQILS